MVFPQRTVYGALMARLMCLSIAVAALLLSAFAQAAPIHKRAASHDYGLPPGYHVPPGYHQPPSNSQPLYTLPDTARRDRRPWYIDPVPSYYGYDGGWYYFGQPGFYRGRYDGGSFGPCWTRTPIGPIWNCG